MVKEKSISDWIWELTIGIFWLESRLGTSLNGLIEFIDRIGGGRAGGGVITESGWETGLRGYPVKM